MSSLRAPRRLLAARWPPSRWPPSRRAPSRRLLYPRCAQIKYHLLHPGYLVKRIKELGPGGYRLTLVVCLVDAEELKALAEVNQQCLRHGATLLLAWSWEEAARYVESFKVFEAKAPTAIMERMNEGDYLLRHADVLTAVRSINKTDSSTLASNFGTLKALVRLPPRKRRAGAPGAAHWGGGSTRTLLLRLAPPTASAPASRQASFCARSLSTTRAHQATASREELALCPGLGGKKVERLYAALHAPFRPAPPSAAAAAPSAASASATGGDEGA